MMKKNAKLEWTKKMNSFVLRPQTLFCFPLCRLAWGSLSIELVNVMVLEDPRFYVARASLTVILSSLVAGSIPYLRHSRDSLLLLFRIPRVLAILGGQTHRGKSWSRTRGEMVAVCGVGIWLLLDRWCCFLSSSGHAVIQKARTISTK